MADETHSDVKRLPFERGRSRNSKSIVKAARGRARCRLEEVGCHLRARRKRSSTRCEELLRQAEARVEKITLDAAGKPNRHPNRSTST